MKTQVSVAGIFIWIFCLHCACSHKKKTESIVSGNESLITIKIEDPIDNRIQFDSLFESFRAIPLETSSACLLNKPVKVVIHDSHIFIQDHNNVLYEFNMDGSFIRQIGNKGRGPGEFITLSDFDLDSAGNIYIIDRSKIVKYGSHGEHLRDFPLNFRTGSFICYPEQLIVRDNGLFIIWGGSSGIVENEKEDLYAMYEITESGEIIHKYFPLIRKIDNRRHRFREFNQEHLIDPLYGVDTIFSVGKDSVYARYHIDFGRYRIREEIPRTLTSFSSFKMEMDACCASTVMDFTEIKDWIYFVFRYQGLAYFNYYSKTLKKTFTYKYSPDDNPQESIVWKIDSSWDDSFITLIEPGHIIEKISQIENRNRLSRRDKALIESLESVDELDNPLLFIVKMKAY